MDFFFSVLFFVVVLNAFTCSLSLRGENLGGFQVLITPGFEFHPVLVVK